MTDIAYVSPEYLSCAETAKLVRAALKAAFPGAKFSVRSSSYSGGASIDVSWTDGPTSADVNAIVGKFTGADFDGMVDLKIYNQHWLLPDGTTATAHGGGGGSTIPEVIGDPPAPNARLVHFGADFIPCHRSISDEWTAEILATFSEKCGVDLDPADKWGVWNKAVPLHVDRTTGELYRMVDKDTEYVSTLFHQYTGTRTRVQA